MFFHRSIWAGRELYMNNYGNSWNNRKDELEKKSERHREENKEKRWEEKRRQEEGSEKKPLAVWIFFCLLGLILAFRGILSPSTEGKILLGGLGFCMALLSIVLRRKSGFLPILSVLLSVFSMAIGFLLPSLRFSRYSALLEDPLSYMQEADSEFSFGEAPLEADPFAGAEESQASELSEAELEAGISYETHMLEREFLLMVTNNNSITVDIDINVPFYGGNGEMLTLEYGAVRCCQPGEIGIARIQLPRDPSANPVAYDHYDLDFNVSETWEEQYTENYGSSFTITSNVGIDGNILAKVENPTGIHFSSVDFFCLLYRGGEVMGYADTTLFDLTDEGFFEFNLPFTLDPEDSSFDGHQILVLETDPEY